MGIPICGACHRPIEERVITALGKNWHVEVCFNRICRNLNLSDELKLLSISFVRFVKNHFWDTNITKEKVLLIVNHISIWLVELLKDYNIKQIKPLLALWTSLL
jgi:hypothetical protein